MKLIKKDNFHAFFSAFNLFYGYFFILNMRAVVKQIIKPSSIFDEMLILP